MAGKAKAAPAPLDIEAELAKLDDDDTKLAHEADKLGEQVEKIRGRLREISLERQAGWSRAAALRQARGLGVESLRALHQLITDAGGVESLAEVGVPGNEE